MLLPVRTEGSRPPFFVVHGLHGVMPIPRVMGSALHADQPLYAINARGLDGKEPPHERLEDAVVDYLADIRRVRPSGPYVLGGVCAGGLIALALAHALSMQGERVGTVILVDPPFMPFYLLPGNRNVDLKADPRLHWQLATNAEQMLRTFADRFADQQPIDINDPAQREAAVSVGTAMTAMFFRFAPPVFEGTSEFIVSAERAVGHFHPQGPWKAVVPKPGRFHIIPGSHDDIFLRHMDPVMRLVQFSLDTSVFA